MSVWLRAPVRALTEGDTLAIARVLADGVLTSRPPADTWSTLDHASLSSEPESLPGVRHSAQLDASTVPALEGGGALVVAIPTFIVVSACT